MLLMALCIAGCGGGGPQAIDYDFGAGGFLDWHVHLHVGSDGIATATGDRGGGCTGMRLSKERQRRLQAALRRARLAQAKSRVVPDVEPPSRVIRSAGYQVSFVGRGSVPERIAPLTRQLDALVVTLCR